MNKIIQFKLINFLLVFFILLIPNFNNAKEILIYADSISYDEKENIIAKGNAKIFKENQLIGILPYEHRELVLDEDEFIKVLWISGAHVDSRYRSQGIGSTCLKLINKYYYPKINSIFVYRNDPSSLAYKWYKNNDFHHLLNILSFNCIDNHFKSFNINLFSLLKSFNTMLSINKLFICMPSLLFANARLQFVSITTFLLFL